MAITPKQNQRDHAPDNKAGSIERFLDAIDSAIESAILALTRPYTTRTGIVDKGAIKASVRTRAKGMSPTEIQALSSSNLDGLVQNDNAFGAAKAKLASIKERYCKKRKNDPKNLLKKPFNYHSAGGVARFKAMKKFGSHLLCARLSKLMGEDNTKERRDYYDDDGNSSSRSAKESFGWKQDGDSTKFAKQKWKLRDNCRDHDYEQIARAEAVEHDLDHGDGHKMSRREARHAERDERRGYDALKTEKTDPRNILKAREQAQLEESRIAENNVRDANIDDENKHEGPLHRLTNLFHDDDKPKHDKGEEPRSRLFRGRLGFGH